MSWLAQFLHPGQTSAGGSYWFWSGIGSGGPWLLAALAPLAYWRHHNCHVHGCPRIGHLDPEVSHPACKRHHSQGHLLGTSRRNA